MRFNPFIKLIMPVLVGIALIGCYPSSTQVSETLQLEEHPLTGAPEPDPLSFQPVQGTREEILAVHVNDRSLGFDRTVSTVEGNPVMYSLGERDDLLAILSTAEQGQPVQTVTVMDGDKTIFEADAGLPSPVLPLQGLWTYDGHWALENLYADQDRWAGEVFIDGELANELQGYDEAFGFQLLSDKPFYFFSRDGHIGYSYAGQEFDIEYDEIPHYRCCSESSLNPVQAENMVAFFASKGEAWSYVELGNFDG